MCSVFVCVCVWGGGVYTQPVMSPPTGPEGRGGHLVCTYHLCPNRLFHTNTAWLRSLLVQGVELELTV